MNTGTKIRTIALIVTIVNKVMVDIGTIDFGNYAVNVAYKVISTIVMIAAAVFAWWYNNDFTEEACIGTGITRQLKAEKKDDYGGEYFYIDDDEEVEDEENESDDMEADEQ